MRIFINEYEVLNLATDYLDMIQPNADKVHEIALNMDMVWNEDIGLYEDVEEISLRAMKNSLDQYREKSISLLETLQGNRINPYPSIP